MVTALESRTYFGPQDNGTHESLHQSILTMLPGLGQHLLCGFDDAVDLDAGDAGNAGLLATSAQAGLAGECGFDDAVDVTKGTGAIRIRGAENG